MPTVSLILLDCIAVASAVLSAALLYRRRLKHNGHLPPGPPGYPILGNVFDMPEDKEWLTYAKWSQEYDSDIISANLAGQSLIILNSYEAVTDLLERRSSIYSGRSHTIMLHELVGFGWNVAFIDYGTFWRGCRKILHQEFHPGASVRYQPHMAKAARVFLSRLAKETTKMEELLRRMAGEIIMSITYGIEVQSVNDPYIEMAEKAVEAVVISSIPGAFLVDSIPVLKYVPEWVPGANFQRIARYYRDAVAKTLNVAFSEVKRKLSNGTQEPSFVSVCLSKIDGKKDVAEQEDIIKSAAATMHAAGSDTTVSAIRTAVLGLISNPSALASAQAQIDAVSGKNQLPTFEERDRLPWVTAIVREALRWNPVTPIAVPHKLIVDDEYRGYHIPAGSAVVGNAWFILRSEKIYGPETSKFKPERFMNGDVLNRHVKDPAIAAFGFGRRICPGRFLAEQSIWITVATIIAVFDISHAVDEKGEIIEPSYEYTSGLVSYPKPFEVKLSPRNDRVLKLLQDTVDMEAL